MLHQDLERTGVPLWGYFCQISSTTSYAAYSGAVPNEKITWGKLAGLNSEVRGRKRRRPDLHLIFAWHWAVRNTASDGWSWSAFRLHVAQRSLKNRKARNYTSNWMSPAKPLDGHQGKRTRGGVTLSATKRDKSLILSPQN